MALNRQASAKLTALAGAPRLELTVAKTGGPVSTSVEVTSTGTDDQTFFDAALTPGPAVTDLDPANTYTLVWAGAFADDGTASLHVRVLDGGGGVTDDETLNIEGKQGDVFFRLVLLP
ncbi:MAG: hypothetical protein ACJ76Y_25885 [Thermoanaerobaculia bacterium]